MAVQCLVMVELDDFMSISNFNDCRKEIIERKKLGRVLEAGRNAPSPGNIQAVEFVVVEDEEKRHHLSEILGDPRISEAPSSIVLVSDMERMRRRVSDELGACYAESAAAAQNMRLLASKEGLSSNLVTGFDSDDVAGLLKCPEGKVPLAVVSFAYCDSPVSSSDRFGMNEVCFYNEYGSQVSSVFDGFEWKGIREEKEVYNKKVKGAISWIRKYL